jgi:hypothetical protein
MGYWNVGMMEYGEYLWEKITRDFFTLPIISALYYSSIPILTDVY